jgi:SAM-dependent methyltransferase
LITGRVSAPGGVEAVTVTIAGAEHEAAIRGLRFELSLDTSRWPAGATPFSVAMRASDGRRANAEGVAEVRPYAAPPADEAGLLAAVAAGQPAMWCEAPALEGGAIDPEKAEVRGWAIAPEGIDRVLVTIDDSYRVAALLGLPRPDLRWCFGEAPAAAAGFAVRLDPEELGGDSHLLTVVAVAADGSAQGMAGTVETSRATPSRARAAAGGRIEPLPPQRLPRAAAVEAAPDLGLAGERYGCYALAGALGLGGRALDVGCETGWGTAILAASMEGAVGVEVSPLAVEEAESRRPGVADFVCADFTRLPFDDGEFDLVACFGGLGHVADPRAALAEMRRVAREGGLLAVSVEEEGAGETLLRRDPLGREALAEWLAESFAHVSVLRPRWVFGGVLDEAGGSAALTGLGGSEVGARRGWIALASDATLPTPPPLVLLDTAGVEDERRLLTEQWRERSVLAEVRMATLRTEVHYTTHALLGTLEREQDRALGAEDELAAARRQLDRLETERRSLLESTSWRATRPMRDLAARLRARRGRGPGPV